METILKKSMKETKTKMKLYNNHQWKEERTEYRITDKWTNSVMENNHSKQFWRKKKNIENNDKTDPSPTGLGWS